MGVSDLSQADIQEAINSANDQADQHKQSKYSNVRNIIGVVLKVSSFFGASYLKLGFH